MSSDRIHIETEGEVLILALRGDLGSLQSSMEPEMRGGLERVVAENLHLDVVVDLSGLSAGGAGLMSILLLVWKPVVRRGGSMVLAAVPAWFRDVLRTAKLDTIWDEYATLIEAMSAVAGFDSTTPAAN